MSLSPLFRFDKEFSSVSQGCFFLMLNMCGRLNWLRQLIVRSMEHFRAPWIRTFYKTTILRRGYNSPKTHLQCPSHQLCLLIYCFRHYALFPWLLRYLKTFSFYFSPLVDVAAIFLTIPKESLAGKASRKSVIIFHNRIGRWGSDIGVTCVNQIGSALLRTKTIFDIRCIVYGHPTLILIFRKCREFSSKD